MLVRCVATRLSEDQKKLLSVRDPAPEYQLRVGGQYLVVGVTFLLPSAPHGGGVRYEIVNDFGQCRSVPACLFELVDPRASKHWLARQDADGSLCLWPEALYAEFFHDDLGEGTVQAVQAFAAVVDLLAQEYGYADLGLRSTPKSSST